MSKMDRRRFLKNATLAMGSAMLSTRARAQAGSSGPTPGKRPNLLFLMTDQQQSLALSLAGNKVLQTPNLDKLAQSGTLFSNAYTACPVCVPARTTILTGKSLQSTGVLDNGPGENPASLTGQEGIFRCQTFDEVLVDNGYVAEYYGKWHMPEMRAQKYANAKDVSLLPPRYRAYVAENKIPTDCPPGSILDITWRLPYIPDPLDVRFGKSPASTQTKGLSRKEQIAAAKAKGIPWGEAGEVGRQIVPTEHSVSAFVARDTISALERLARQDKPFSLTASFNPPHPPYISCSPYHEAYPAKEMPLPVSFRDPMANSPYQFNGNRIPWCQNPETLGYLISNYYGNIKEVDDWIGRILETLDRLHLRDNTLIVFLSDHGEMLGAHGMYSKMVFLDESSHIPMFFSHPGRIPAGKVVSDPVGHIDVFATILDYLGVPAPASEGHSLRGLVEGDARDRRNPFTVSEWPHGVLPNYMVCDRQWKLMFGKSPHDAAGRANLDALYDLKNDPYEMHNLIGSNPDRAHYKGQAETMKEMLLAWMRQVGSPDLNGVLARSVLT